MTITGKVPDVTACLSALDVGVVASLWSETIARAALEIMACGRPLVSTSVGVMPDLLPASALVAPGDVDALAGVLRRAALSLQRLTLLPAQAMRLRAAMPTTRRQLLRLLSTLHRLPMRQPIMRRRAFRVLLLRRKLPRFAPMCSPIRLPKLAARPVLPTTPA